MQLIVFIYTKSTNNSFNIYSSWQIVSDHVGINFFDYFQTMTTFRNHVRQRRLFPWALHFIFLLLRTREGYMSTITKSGPLTAKTIPFKHAWASLPSTGIKGDSAIINLACSFAGSVTITQSRLVPCILQGVEYTDPMEWSNSHLLHWRQIHTDCLTNSQLFKGCHFFSLERWFSHFIWDGSATFHLRTAPQHFIWGRLRNTSLGTAPQHFVL